MDDRISNIAGIDISSIVRENDPYYKFDAVAPKLNLIISSAKDILTYPDFWNELPDATKTQVLSQFEALLNNITVIQQNRDNGTWLAANYENQQNVIRSAYDSLYDPLIKGIREYKNDLDTTKTETRAALEQLQTAIKEVESTSKQANQASKLAGEVAAGSATSRLAQFFEQLVTGVPDGDLKPLKKRHPNAWWLVNRYDRFIQARQGYEASARKWLAGLLLSIVGTLVIAVLIFRHDDFSKLTLNAVVAKALILGAPAYAIRFCSRNFSANKHLATVNRHRAIVLHTLLAFLAREEVTEPVREKVIVEAARQVFEPGDSGYLSGADGSIKDSVIEFPLFKQS